MGQSDAGRLYRRIYQALTAEAPDATIGAYDRQRHAKSRAPIPEEQRAHLVELLESLSHPDSLTDQDTLEMLRRFERSDYEWFYGFEIDGQAIGTAIRELRAE